MFIAMTIFFAAIFIGVALFAVGLIVVRKRRKDKM